MVIVPKSTLCLFLQAGRLAQGYRTELPFWFVGVAPDVGLAVWVPAPYGPQAEPPAEVFRKATVLGLTPHLAVQAQYCYTGCAFIVRTMAL